MWPDQRPKLLVVDVKKRARKHAVIDGRILVRVGHSVILSKQRQCRAVDLIQRPEIGVLGGKNESRATCIELYDVFVAMLIWVY